MSLLSPTRISGVRIDADEADASSDSPQPWTFTVSEAATDEPIAELVGGGAAAARRSVDSAATALSVWSQTLPGRRVNALRAIAAELRDVATVDELAVLISRETGKRLAEAHAELEMSAGFFDFYADLLGSRSDSVLAVAPGMRNEISQRPLGVVAVLSPWNFPLSIPARKIAPALAAGCTVLFKPSEVAASSALRFAEIVERHVPVGALNTLFGAPEQISDIWLADRRVRGLSFTGSTRVGKILAAAVAPQFVRTVMELGGNSPFIVLDDADVESAVQVLMTAKFRNNGQSCIAANTVWVHRSRQDELLERFTAAMNTLVLGDPLDPSTTLGPTATVTDPSRIAGLVEDAERAGATTVRASVELPTRGRFCLPTISVDAPRNSRIVADEIFGPALAVVGYDRIEEPLGATQESPFGLGGYVVGPQVRAAEIARRLDVGIVGVNTGTPNVPHQPFGGLKESGLGVEGHRGGLDAFMTWQSVALA